MNAPVDHLERFVDSSNQWEQRCYENYPVLHAGNKVVIWGKSRQTYQRDYGQAISKETGETTPIYARFVTDIDGFVLECSLGGNLSRNNWDNAYLNHFKFSYRDITMPTTSSSAITTTVSAIKTNGPHPPQYHTLHYSTVDALLDLVKTTDETAFDGLYVSFLSRARKVGLCAPRYKGAYLDSEREIALIAEQDGAAPVLFYYFPEGIVRCHYIEEGLSVEAQKNPVAFMNGKKARGEVPNSTVETVTLADNNKVSCAFYKHEDRQKATFLLNDSVLVTVEVYSRYSLHPKEVLQKLSFEMITV